VRVPVRVRGKRQRNTEEWQSGQAGGGGDFAKALVFLGYSHRFWGEAGGSSGDQPHLLQESREAWIRPHRLKRRLDSEGKHGPCALAVGAIKLGACPLRGA